MNIKKPLIKSGILQNRQRTIFTRAGLDIVVAGMLNFCVRDGNRCDHSAITTGSFVMKEVPSKPDDNQRQCLSR